MAFALQQLGGIAHAKSNYAQARSLLEQALALFKEIENQEGIASILDDLAYGAIDQGEYSRARELAEQALVILRKVGDKRLITYALLRLGRVHFFSHTDLAHARRLAQEALTISKEVGYKWGMASSLGLLGQLALLMESDDITAHDLLEEALSIRRELKDRWGIAWGLYSLANVHAFQGNYATARGLYEESLTIVRELDDKEFLASCLERLGEVAAQGEPAWAARLWGAAEMLRQTIGTPMAPVNRAGYERALATSRQELGEQIFDTAWAQGRAMTPEQALSAQEAVLPPLEVKQLPVPLARETPPVGLTTREVEVLRLLAQGLTDAQIAEQLVIARRTVNWYLTSIYSKIGVSSRAAATRYAVEQHLV
jgi:ATP/maltotriose-dependent transcriptional regulator MalT